VAVSDGRSVDQLAALLLEGGTGGEENASDVVPVTGAMAPPVGRSPWAKTLHNGASIPPPLPTQEPPLAQQASDAGIDVLPTYIVPSIIAGASMAALTSLAILIGLRCRRQTEKRASTDFSETDESDGEGSEGTSWRVFDSLRSAKSVQLIMSKSLERFNSTRASESVVRPLSIRVEKSPTSVSADMNPTSSTVSTPVTAWGCTAESEGGAGGGDGAAGAQLPGSSHTPVLLLKRTRSNLGEGGKDEIWEGAGHAAEPTGNTVATGRNDSGRSPRA